MGWERQKHSLIHWEGLGWGGLGAEGATVERKGWLGCDSHSFFKKHWFVFSNFKSHARHLQKIWKRKKSNKTNTKERKIFP